MQNHLTSFFFFALFWLIINNYICIYIAHFWYREWCLHINSCFDFYILQRCYYIVKRFHAPLLMYRLPPNTSQRWWAHCAVYTHFVYNASSRLLFSGCLRRWLGLWITYWKHEAWLYHSLTKLELHVGPYTGYFKILVLCGKYTASNCPSKQNCHYWLGNFLFKELIV